MNQEQKQEALSKYREMQTLIENGLNKIKAIQEYEKGKFNLDQMQRDFDNFYKKGEEYTQLERQQESFQQHCNALIGQDGSQPYQDLALTINITIGQLVGELFNEDWEKHTRNEGRKSSKTGMDRYSSKSNNSLRNKIR